MEKISTEHFYPLIGSVFSEVPGECVKEIPVTKADLFNPLHSTEMTPGRGTDELYSLAPKYKVSLTDLFVSLFITSLRRYSNQHCWRRYR